MPRIAARASVLRTKDAWSKPGRRTSSTYVPWPVRSRASSTLDTRIPEYRAAPAIGALPRSCRAPSMLGDRPNTYPSCVVATRRLGTETSETRATLLDATEQLMLDSGYAAVSSRRVAAVAGVRPALVHYYFRTMDDLFLAAFQRRAEQAFAHQQRALAVSTTALVALGGEP